MSLHLHTPRVGATTIAVTSGKGGVGKTSLTVNLAASLTRLGYRVGILDADFGLGNVDVMLGLTPSHHLGAVLAGQQTLDEIAVIGPGGVRIIPAGSGIRALTTFNHDQWMRLREVIDRARVDLDFLLVDTAPGIYDTVLELVRLADHVLVVTSYEPTAIVDAYAMLKLLNVADPARDVGVVVNAAADAGEGQLVFHQLQTAMNRFLGASATYYGSIARDPRVREAVLEQRAIVNRWPDSPASRSYRRLALRIASLPPRPATAAHAAASAEPPLFTDYEFAALEAPRCA